MRLNLFGKPSLYLRARCIAWIVNIIGVIFISTATSLQEAFYTDGVGGAVDGIQLAPLVYSLLWISIVIGLGLAGKRHHPGIDVAFDLLGALLACGVVWLLIDWTNTIDGYNQNCYDTSCTPTKARVIRASEIIGIITILMSIILHTVFFYEACVAVHELRGRPKPGRDSFHELQEDIGADKK